MSARRRLKPAKDPATGEAGEEAGAAPITLQIITNVALSRRLINNVKIGGANEKGRSRFTAEARKGDESKSLRPHSV